MSSAFTSPPRSPCACLRRYYELKAESSRSGRRSPAFYRRAVETVSPTTSTLLAQLQAPPTPEPPPHPFTRVVSCWQTMRSGAQYKGEWAQSSTCLSSAPHKCSVSRCSLQHGYGQMRNAQLGVFYDGHWSDGEYSAPTHTE